VDHPASARAVGVGHGDVGLDPVVRHREESHRLAVQGSEPAAAERLGDLRQRVAGLEHLGADQVGRDVAVPEAEPRRLDAVRLELRARAPRLVAAAPPALDVDAVTEGVHHGVEVGADLEAVDPPVVGGVGHDGDLGVGGPSRYDAGAEAVEEALEEAGPADAAGEDGDTAERGCG
jgi:hypothetical protein